MDTSQNNTEYWKQEGERVQAARFRKAGDIIGLLKPLIKETNIQQALSIGSGF
jgi:hypothetical protein